LAQERPAQVWVPWFANTNEAVRSVAYSGIKVSCGASKTRSGTS